MLTLITVVLVIFNLLVQNTSIINRGIAVGLAIDLEGEDVIVTAQLVLPKNGGISAGGNNYTQVSKKSETIEGALDGISSNIGVQLSLAHVIVVVFGANFIQADKYNDIEFLFSDEKLTDDTILVASDGMGKDILKANTPTNETAIYQLLLMISPVKTSFGVIEMTLKDYVKNYYSKNKGNFMPLAHLEKVDASTDQSKEGETEAEAIRLSRTAIIGDSGQVGELNLYQSEGLSLVNNKIQSGNIQIKGRDDRNIVVQIKSSDCKTKYDIENLEVTYDISLRTLRGEAIKDDKGMMTFMLDQVEQDRLYTEVQKRILECFNLCANYGVDIFGIGDGFYKRFNKKWGYGNSSDYLKEVKVKVALSIKQI